MDKAEVITFIEKQKAVAVLRLPDPELYPGVEEALTGGGVKVIEITMSTPDAISLIRDARKSDRNDRLIGVGSILDSETAKKAIDAGAQFVVSPVVNEEVIEVCRRADIAVMPGAFTPTEIQRAWDLGADIVKVFPADVVGQKFFSAVLAPMPHLKLMPTGGVSLTNGREWLDAGACAVGVGSALVDKNSLNNKDFESIRKNAKTLMNHLNGDENE